MVLRTARDVWGIGPVTVATGVVVYTTAGAGIPTILVNGKMWRRVYVLRVWMVRLIVRMRESLWTHYVKKKVYKLIKLK